MVLRDLLVCTMNFITLSDCRIEKFIEIYKNVTKEGIKLSVNGKNIDKNDPDHRRLVS